MKNSQYTKNRIPALPKLDLQIPLRRLKYEIEPNAAATSAEAGRAVDANADQLLDGAKAIQKYLVYLGLVEMTEKKVFNWAGDGRLPVKKIGNRLIANKRTLLRHFGID